MNTSKNESNINASGKIQSNIPNRRSFLKTSLCAVAGARAGMSQGFGKEESSRERPNVLLIITDQQSADSVSFRLGEIGRNYLHTPSMDRIFAEGVDFERAYCATPLCVPSRTSMLSGQYPHTTGVVDNSPNKSSKKRCRNFTTFGDVFREAGYNTAYIGKFHTPYDPEKEFEHTANIRNNGADPRMLEPATAFLEEQRNAENPFFLVTSFNNPHNICEWARGERGEELPDGAIESPPLESCPPLRANHRPPENETEIMEFMRESYHATEMTPVKDFTEADWRKLQWGYYRMVEIVDRRIGKVLDALRETGHEEDTLVVFLSDHGECQGAHRWNQKTVFFDESSRVICAFRWPGVIEPGTRRQLVHTGIDLFPTLCGLAGVTPPNGLPGRDLADVIINNSPEDRDYIVTSTHFIQGNRVDGTKHTPHGRMVRGQQYKYCVYDEGDRREELYDMLNDPGETVNLANKDECQKTIQQYRQYLSEHCRKHKAPCEDFFQVRAESDRSTPSDCSRNAGRKNQRC